jgi:hypothetical protein
VRLISLGRPSRVAGRDVSQVWDRLIAKLIADMPDPQLMFWLYRVAAA